MQEGAGGAHWLGLVAFVEVWWCGSSRGCARCSWCQEGEGSSLWGQWWLGCGLCLGVWVPGQLQGWLLTPRAFLLPFQGFTWDFTPSLLFFSLP